MNFRLTLLILLYNIVSIETTVDVEKTRELVNAGGVGNDEFGHAVDITDKFIAIGIPGDNLNKGSVMVYSKTGNSWDDGARITPPTVSDDGNFGWSVALHDNLLIVGSPTYNNSEGIAYIYSNTGLGWTLSTTLQPDITRVKFGESVSLTTNLVVIGCQQSKVFVYRHSGSNTWSLEAALTSSDGSAFGSSVTAYGNYIAVGARDHKINDRRKAGAAYIFHHDNFIWSEVEKLTSDVPSLYGLFGYSIDMDETRVVIGCNNPNGNVFVFTRTNDSWSQTAKLSPTNVQNGDYFGSSVSISGDKIAIGARQETSPGAGTAYIFLWENSAWKEAMKLTPTDEAGDGAIFGRSIAVYNHHVVVGSPGFNNSIGSALFFDFTPILAFSVECYDTSIKGVYYKNHVKSDLLEFRLNDKTCTNFLSNSTHAWMISKFDECGTRASEDDTNIFVENALHVRLLTYRTNITVYETTHQYNMRCKYPRSYELTIIDGLVVTVNTTITNKTNNGTFSFMMDIYDSIEYLKISMPPISVVSRQPIYVEISSVDTTNATFKFAVDTCFATRRLDKKGDTDTFFLNKCKVDPTFQQILSSPKRFRFSVEAFKFIELVGAVYFHCRINVCVANSNSPLCTQTCTTSVRRKRRQLLPEEMSYKKVKEVTLTSKERISYTKKKSCTDLQCPKNSHCVELYPAKCRCNTGFVFAQKDKSCSDELILDINKGLRLELLWWKEYNDTSSIAFLSLASKIENLLYRHFTERRNISDIVGIKVRKFRKGSVIVDYSIMYARTSNSKIIYDALNDTISSNNSVIFDNNSMIEVKIEYVPGEWASSSRRNMGHFTITIFSVLVLFSFLFWSS